MEDEDRIYDRRESDRELARVDERVRGLEKHVDGLLVASGQNSASVVRMEARMETLSREVDRTVVSLERATDELRAAIAAGDAAIVGERRGHEARVVSWVQLLVGGALGMVAASVPTLLLIATGHFS